jgi:regulator of replication initiation timing
MVILAPSRTLHYLSDDIRSLMQGAPYLQMSNRGLLRLLEETVQVGRKYERELRQYPEVQIEPLDFFYQCRRNIDAMNSHLLRDLLFWLSWREANWGAWLAMLAPRPEYFWIVANQGTVHPEGKDLRDLTLSMMTGQVPDHLKEHHALALELRKMIEPLPSQPRRLRENLKESQDKSYRAELDAVRKAYREGGLEKALPLTRQGLLGHFGQDYWAWSAKSEPVGR